MKVIAVDDQFVNAKGKPMDSVPLVMMAATKIGERQGQELYKEMQKRGWDVKETAVMAITADELDTARRRTTGSMDALKAAGFPEKQIYKVPPNPTISRALSTPRTPCWFSIRRSNTGWWSA
jgi:L-arabinose transport system substrate-binding protein